MKDRSGSMMHDVGGRILAYFKLPSTLAWNLKVTLPEHVLRNKIVR